MRSKIVQILAENYTPEEICELLDLTSIELTSEFSDKISERLEKIMEIIQDDLGYDTEDTED